VVVSSCWLCSRPFRNTGAAKNEKMKMTSSKSLNKVVTSASSPTSRHLSIDQEERNVDDRLPAGRGALGVQRRHLQHQ
jgi:hypothetical protein